MVRPAVKPTISHRRSPTSIELLQVAKDLKRSYELPESLSLWAVENPLRNPASRLAAKVGAHNWSSMVRIGVEMFALSETYWHGP